MEFLGRLDTEAGLVAEGKVPGEPEQAEQVDQVEQAEGGGATLSEARSTPERSGGFDRWPGGLKG